VAYFAPELLAYFTPECVAYFVRNSHNKPLPVEMSARIMGKNDLWIAATAFVTKSTLLTTDDDFDHLDPQFIDVVKLKTQ
jgi:hypothetical protein